MDKTARRIVLPYPKDENGKPLCRWCRGPVSPPRQCWCSEDGDTCSLVSGELRAPLEFKKDERGCWVATSFINLKAVRKLRESL